MRRRLLSLVIATLFAVAILTACDRTVVWLRPELTVRRNERTSFCAYDPELGWRNRPYAAGTFFGARIAHNSQGQRDRERSAARRSAGLRAMVLGDSFVWGFRIDAADRFSDRLEKKLPGSEILNFGCSGYGQDQEYLLLKREIGRYAPDLVIVVVHVGSDLENNVNSFQYGYFKPLFGLEGEELVLGGVPVPKDSLGTRIDRWMTPRSALWNLLANRGIGGMSLRARFVNALDRRGLAPQPKAVRSGTPRVAMTCRLSRAIATLVTGNGAEALFVLAPVVDADDQSIVPRREYAELRGCLQANAIPVLDLEPVFRGYIEAHPHGSITLKGNRHWSGEGNEVVSEALYRFLQDHALRISPRRASEEARG